ncbi:hypothetical protein [Bombella sp. ESL0385]|uniref:hypothetical protein n=1 Tax=Bombella sp. ESL0385 TaxID=2676446 RepID=UPI0012D923DA|nr:hypothetical protein [Bombella sp. ESL0385]MUG90131.1 hypothetical protein [Bombella sp. ESL0385]
MSLFSGGLNTLKSVQDEGLAGQASSLEQSLGASFTAGINDMPVVRIGDWIRHEVKSSEGDTLTPEDANARYGIKGVLNFDKPVSSALAQTLNEEKQNNLIRQNTIRNGPDGPINGILNTAAGALPSFLDPINYAAALIPGLGEERIGMALGGAAARAEGFGMERVADGLISAEGLNRRVGAALSSNLPGRIVQGASQGAIGMAALEPLNMVLDRDEHNDWSAGQALRNIAFGGVMGGGLHGIGYTLSKRLERAGTNAKGQVLADGLTSLASDTPSNAESLLNIHEVQNSKDELERVVASHDALPTDTDVDTHVPLRDKIADDLSQLQQNHADTVSESSLYEPPDEDASTDIDIPPSTSITKPQPTAPSLFTFLTRHGGVLDEGGELKANDIHRQRIGLVRRNGGMPLDKARELSVEHGYLKPDADINDLLEAMIEESHGRKVFPEGVLSQHPSDLSNIEDHYREQAADDVDEAANAADVDLTPDEHNHAINTILSGAHPDAAIEDALRVSRHSTWQRYEEMLDHGRAFHRSRIGEQQNLLHALTRERLGLYAQHLDAALDGMDLYDMADAILKHNGTEDAVESALRTIEAERGKGHDATSWQGYVEEAYQTAKQKLDALQNDAAEAIMRNLHGYESHEVTQSRAGLSALKDASPSPRHGQNTSPLPASSIEHLDLSEVGSNPALVGRMMEGVDGAPAWPIVLGDGVHTVKINGKGQDIGGGHGRLHISARHGEELKKRGFASIDDFVKRAIADANQVRLDEGNGSFFTVKMGDKQGSKHKHPTTVLHLIKKDGYYRVGTADEFKTGYLKNRKLLWEKDLNTNSNPTGQGSDSFNPHEQNMSDTLRSGRDDERHNSFLQNENTAPKSQDKSITEAQSYSDQIDQQLAALGDQISPEELADIHREKALSDGNADALASAAACLTRKAL